MGTVSDSTHRLKTRTGVPGVRDARSRVWGWRDGLGRLPENPQCTVSQYSQLPVQRMLSPQEGQDRGAALRKLVHSDGQPHVAARIFQPSLQRLHGVVAPPGGRVHFSKIQVELRLISLHSNGGVAQLFRLPPLL